jgi:hypothetical protein
VVRSRTAPGEAIDVIATVRPYDDPGVERVWYRLRPVASTIVHKTHIVYPLSDAKLKRLRALFLEAIGAQRTPGYAPRRPRTLPRFDRSGGSRYLLLDDAHYFIMTFIRGPVCRGQVAVDVIEDQFWVAFLDPDRDLSVTVPGFLAKAAPLLSLPAEHASGFSPGSMWLEYNVEAAQVPGMRESIRRAIHTSRPALDWIWDGDRKNATRCSRCSATSTTRPS